MFVCPICYQTFLWHLFPHYGPYCALFIYVWGTGELEISFSLGVFPSPKLQPTQTPMPKISLQGSLDSMIPLFPETFCLLYPSTINFRLPVLTFKASLYFESVFITSLIFSMSHSLAPIPHSGHSSKFIHIPGTLTQLPLPPISPTIYQAFSHFSYGLSLKKKKIKETPLWHNKQMYI